MPEVRNGTGVESLVEYSGEDICETRELEDFCGDCINTTGFAVANMFQSIGNFIF